MKKKSVIWLYILFGIGVVLAFFVYFQWNNISAVIDSFKYSQEEVAEKMESNKQELQNYINENENVNVRDLTEEEAEALNKGELTEEEVVEILVSKPSEGQQLPQNPSVVEKPSKTPEVDEPTKEEIAGRKVSEAIARLYIQKNLYLSKLDAIEAEARARYIAYNSEERNTAKPKIIAEYFPKVASWEKECDAIVYGILDEIKTAIKESGQDAQIADKIEQAYLDEKRLKKSYFIGRYMD